MRRWYRRLGQDCVLLYPSASSVVKQPIIRRRIGWAIGSVVKQTPLKKHAFLLHTPPAPDIVCHEWVTYVMLMYNETNSEVLLSHLSWETSWPQFPCGFRSPSVRSVVKSWIKSWLLLVHNNQYIMHWSFFCSVLYSLLHRNLLNK